MLPGILSRFRLHKDLLTTQGMSDPEPTQGMSDPEPTHFHTESHFILTAGDYCPRQTDEETEAWSDDTVC